MRLNEKSLTLKINNASVQNNLLVFYYVVYIFIIYILSTMNITFTSS